MNKSYYEKMVEEVKNTPIIGFDDYPFKKIFSNNINLLKKLVELVTNIKFDEYFEIISPNLKRGIELKGQTCDLLISATSIFNDFLIDLESQQYRMEENAIFDRALLTACMSYVSMHEQGDDYSDKHRVIVIYFINDKYDVGFVFKNKNKSKYIINLKDDENEEYNNINMYFINVKEAITHLDKNNVNDKMLVKYLEVLSAKKLDDYLVSSESEVRLMAETIKKINDSKQEKWEAMLAELNELRNKAELNSARASGYKEGLNQTVKTLVNSGFDKKAIAKALNLDLEYIEEIIK